MKIKTLTAALEKAHSLSTTPLVINGGEAAAVTLTRDPIGCGYQLQTGAHAASENGFVIAQFIDGKIQAMPVYTTAENGAQLTTWGDA